MASRLFSIDGKLNTMYFKPLSALPYKQEETTTTSNPYLCLYLLVY